jgi:hypothetical protein
LVWCRLIRWDRSMPKLHPRPLPVAMQTRCAGTPGRLFYRTLLLWLAAALPLTAELPDVSVGSRLVELRVGAKTYRNAEVRQVTPRSVVLWHDDGLSSVLLRDLPPEWQQRFGYDPEAAEAAEARLQREQLTVEAHQQAQLSRQATARQGASFDQLVQRLGEPPLLAPEVDLRPLFFQLGVKDQGRRPSCSVFAVVSALEYQNAVLTGRPEKLSEEYLIWATHRVTQRPMRMTGSEGEGAAEAVGNEDAGFALWEVVSALRTYGIPLQEAMPNTLGGRMDRISDPSPELVQEARSRRRVYIHLMASRDRASQVSAMTHALNAGVPVVIGVRWPHYRTIRGGILSEQKPRADYAHAVTLVGYTCRSGRPEDVVFIFKNSYGARWGQGGYGRVTYRYLEEHLLGAVLLEVQPPEQSRDKVS